MKKKERRKLKCNLKIMENKLDQLEKRINGPEQCSGRNCILIHRIPEKQTEDTDNLAFKTFYEQMQIEVKEEDIDRSHRLRKSKIPVEVKINNCEVCQTQRPK